MGLITKLCEFFRRARGGVVEIELAPYRRLLSRIDGYNFQDVEAEELKSKSADLARRDAEWMGPVYRFLGLSVGSVQQQTGLARRKDAYACDITYLTAKQAGFDYLRDHLCTEPGDLCWSARQAYRSRRSLPRPCPRRG